MSPTLAEQDRQQILKNPSAYRERHVPIDLATILSSLSAYELRDRARRGLIRSYRLGSGRRFLFKIGDLLDLVKPRPTVADFDVTRRGCA